MLDKCSAIGPHPSISLNSRLIFYSRDTPDHWLLFRPSGITANQKLHYSQDLLALSVSPSHGPQAGLVLAIIHPWPLSSTFNTSVSFSTQQPRLVGFWLFFCFVFEDLLFVMEGLSVSHMCLCTWGTGVTSDCEPHDMGTGFKLGYSGKLASEFNC